MTGRATGGSANRSVAAALRGPTGRAALVAAAVVIVLGLVAAFGGFRTAPPVGAARWAPGATVELARWQVVVDRVELSDTDAYGSPGPTTLRLHLRLTWTGDRSTYGPTTGLVTLLVPGGPAPDPQPTTVPTAGYQGGFDPDVPRPLVLDYAWPAPTARGGKSVQPPAPRVPAVVQVVLRDEYSRPTYLDDDNWSLTGPVGHVSAPVRDVRR